ncbi:DUF3098 domain-containing protein [Flavobacterium agricola]|uniref:DUF3098 domain-containing protein n=1 Tax=Flavobacterium agricola TaxID=2870839 RepID=A0ABY6M2C3_9FLAO|nr:DUF3098 domain-containing protein [Flavobacterium agricola]UYW01266.1 DUF3098 domain-containing protein [Flavobacterium agricola]
MEKETKQNLLFSAYQYKILIGGIVAIALGFILMIGGGSDNPEVYSDAIFSFRRIHLAPTIVLLGFAICVYSIFAKQKVK